MVREQVFRVVKEAMQDLNDELEYETLRNVTYETPVFGGEASIDSLSLVRLVLGLERDISDIFCKTVQLANEKAMSYRNSPFRTVGALVDYIVEKLEAGNA